MSGVCVLGAGIVGLSTAVNLQETGINVTLISDELPHLNFSQFAPVLTSDGVGGFWEPHEIPGTSTHLQKKWGRDTYEWLESSIKTGQAPEIGVSLVSGYHLLSKQSSQLPPWTSQVKNFRYLTENEVRTFSESSSDFKHGWFYTTLMAEGRWLMPHLFIRLQELGGKIINRKVNGLEELLGRFEVVVNCTGLGSKQLLNDDTVYPVRGQVLKVKAPWIKHFYNFDDMANYIHPGMEHITAGGTHQVNNWSTAIDPADTKAIWEGCCRLCPSLQHGDVSYEWAGLRPCREGGIRLEKEVIRFEKENLKVVHNYGHGGGGHSLFQGCALDSTELVNQLLR